MNRREVLQAGVGTITLGLGGCVSTDFPELRIRNTSEQAHRIHVQVFDQDNRLLSSSFEVPSKAHSDEQGTVNEVYPQAGTYQIKGSIDDGPSVTETVKLADEPLTHVTAKSGRELNIGRMAP